jgi:hypothetical protein
MSLYFEELDYRPTPIGALSLRRRRELSLGVDVFEIKLGDEYLMSSLFTASERRSPDLQIARRLLAAICDNLVFDLLPFIERVETRAFDRRNMDEDVPAAFFRLNKSEPLLRVEPLHGAARHCRIST